MAWLSGPAAYAEVGRKHDIWRSRQLDAKAREQGFCDFDESVRTTDWVGNVTGEDDQAYFEANGMGD